MNLIAQKIWMLDKGKTYGWLKSMGVSHALMERLAKQEGIEFYRMRQALGKSVGEVPPEHQETVLRWFEENQGLFSD